MPSFTDFLEDIKANKEKALQIIESHGPDDVIAEAALIAVWQHVFERVQQSEDDELEKTASLLQRLWSSINVRKSLVLKEKEEVRKAEDHEAKKDSIRHALQDLHHTFEPLDADTLALIEEELNLL